MGIDIGQWKLSKLKCKKKNNKNKKENITQKLWNNIKCCSISITGTLNGEDREMRAEEIFEKTWLKFCHCMESSLSLT